MAKAEEKKVVEEKPVETTEEEKGFDYQHSASFKVSEKFKERFMTKTAGGPTMSVDGLVALGHVKGIWKLDTEVLQYPCADNGNMCICKSVIGGYDWNPIENKVVKVEYSDIGDASPNNCKGPVAASFIRMAATRATGRALRKYTNIDMLCTEELGEEDVATESMSEIASESMVNQDQLVLMKGIIQQKSIDKATFEDMLIKTFNTNNFQQLTSKQADIMIQILNSYVVPAK